MPRAWLRVHVIEGLASTRVLQFALALTECLSGHALDQEPLEYLLLVSCCMGGLKLKIHHQEIPVQHAQPVRTSSISVDP